MKLIDKVHALPKTSGVYIMKNIENEIIYIGKAKNLHSRVGSYFNASKKNLKTVTMVSKVHNFEYILTPSEKDALVLENNLIKKHQPFYNILLKDGKSFPYIKINIKQKYPALIVTRKVLKDGAKYFGPFLNGIHVYDILEIIASAFKLKDCNLNLEGDKIYKKPCLNFHMGKCDAPCLKRNEEAYKAELKKVINFLSGDYKEVKEILEIKMKKFSDMENFEEALKIRDNINMLDMLTQKTVVMDTSKSSYDVFGVAKDGFFLAASYMVIRDGKLLGNENFVLNTGKEMVDGDDDESLLIDFIMQHYTLNGVATTKLMLPNLIKNTEILSAALSEIKGAKVEIVVPKAGDKLTLVKEAGLNAAEYIKKNIDMEKLKEARTSGAMEELKKVLGLKNLPVKIECFDISNISGTNSVASMTVVLNGEKMPKLYRKFKIKTVEGADDYASHAEVLKRRLNELKTSSDESFGRKPDLICIDGGKGQLSVTSKILFDERQDIDICSLAEKNEEIFIPRKPESIVLPRSSYALKLLQLARDEAHRFAITYHRNLRDKAMKKSELDDVPLLGEKKKKALMLKFKSVNNIKNATISDLMAVDGIGEKLAQNILNIINIK